MLAQTGGLNFFLGLGMDVSAWPRIEHLATKVIEPNLQGIAKFLPRSHGRSWTAPVEAKAASISLRY